MDCNGSIIVSAGSGKNTELTSVDSFSGNIRWTYAEGGIFPGTVAGKNLIFAGAAFCTELAVKDGSVRCKIQLEGCTYPGSIFTGGDRLYLVNNAGVFSYASSKK